jgi:phosphoglycolate phosphatase-like HAD superfamily hydrolase
MRVLLFDIDGTLIRSGGAGKAAMEAALRQAFRLEEIRDGVPYSGRTDPAIGYDLLALHDLETSAENLSRLHTAYLEVLPQCLATHSGIILPGIVDTLNRLQRDRKIALGLLTGNVRRGAEYKLGHFGLWEFFAFGGFGDNHSDRNMVARVALENAESHLQKKLDTNDVWVIGDTPHDVTCARSIGAKAVAVATGWNSYEELCETGADWVLNDFTQAHELLGQWC